MVSKEGIQWRGNRITGGAATGGEFGGNGACGGIEEGEKGAETPSAGVRDKLEGPGTAEDDTIHLKRRVGLFSGVALIVGTMIGKIPLWPAKRPDIVPFDFHEISK